MSSEVKPNLQLEIGHVLFIDIVGYSKLLIDDQREFLQQLNQIVRWEAEAAGSGAPARRSGHTRSALLRRLLPAQPGASVSLFRRI